MTSHAPTFTPPSPSKTRSKPGWTPPSCCAGWSAFFTELPERDRLVIDAYLGVGLSPTELARSLNVTPSRVSQIYHAVVQRAANHIQTPEPAGTEAPTQRATDRLGRSLDELVALREQALRQGEQGAWGELIEHVLSAPEAPQESEPSDAQTGIIQVSASTRWG